MKARRTTTHFLKRISLGRRFEKWERSQWNGDYNQRAKFEMPTKWKNKRGRIDICLVDNDDGMTIIAEIKATNWDAMRSHRVRPNALRHARQIWRYIDSALEKHSAAPGIIYPKTPKKPNRKKDIEAIFEERFVQVVWRDE